MAENDRSALINGLLQKISVNWIAKNRLEYVVTPGMSVRSLRLDDLKPLQFHVDVNGDGQMLTFWQLVAMYLLLAELTAEYRKIADKKEPMREPKLKLPSELHLTDARIAYVLAHIKLQMPGQPAHERGFGGDVVDRLFDNMERVLAYMMDQEENHESTVSKNGIDFEPLAQSGGPTLEHCRIIADRLVERKLADKSRSTKRYRLSMGGMIEAQWATTRQKAKAREAQKLAHPPKQAKKPTGGGWLSKLFQRT